MIPPALDSEEWASHETLRGFDGSVVRIGMGAVVVGDVPRRAGVLFAKLNNGIAEYPLPVIEGAALPALIALANAALPDDDPRKITWRRVGILRAAIQRILGEVQGDDLDSKLSRAGLYELDALADALQSYLPPRPE